MTFNRDDDNIFALTNTLNIEAKKLGLIINSQTTKIMKLITIDGRRNVMVDQKLENFDKFVYQSSNLYEEVNV